MRPPLSELARAPGLGGVVFGQAVLALAGALLATSCASFEAAPDGGAGECAPPSCAGAGPSCRSYDFAGPACPADWAFSGEAPPAVTADCVGGKLHVAAASTLDVTSSLELSGPAVAPYSIWVAARIAVQQWDGGEVLHLDVGSEMPFELSAKIMPSGDPSFELCTSVDCRASFDSAPGAEHLFQFDVTPSGTTATVDCQPFGTTPAVVLGTSAPVTLTFGKSEANPIDGTLDDVVVSFR
jgi:hypothetical protein